LTVTSEVRGEFLKFGDLFKIVAPGVPAKRDGLMSREYNDVRVTTLKLERLGYIEVKGEQMPGGKGRVFGYRLAAGRIG
jgi:hypothetical protein